MAGKFEVAVRIWVYWVLAIKMSGKLIKLHVSLGYEPFLFSISEALFPFFVQQMWLIKNVWTHSK